MWKAVAIPWEFPGNKDPLPGNSLGVKNVRQLHERSTGYEYCPF